jgi:hypothetical protein
MIEADLDLQGVPTDLIYFHGSYTAPPYYKRGTWNNFVIAKQHVSHFRFIEPWKESPDVNTLEVNMTNGTKIYIYCPNEMEKFFPVKIVNGRKKTK